MVSEERSVLAELSEFRSKVSSEKLRHWEAPTGAKCLKKIVQDWGIILAAHQLLLRYPSPFTLAVAVFLVSWGQRGLSCLAHDSIHRNLVKNVKLNDAIANIFLSPAAMSTAGLQRRAHGLHHRYLGSSLDPDHGMESDTSLKHYRTGVYSHKSILSLFVYDLLDPVMFYQNAIGSLLEKPGFLLSWWTVVSILTSYLDSTTSPLPFFLTRFRVSSFVVLFHFTRCTVSFAFFILREIMDHSGLPSTSILMFTRSSPWGNWFQKFVQPHDDNYHLLHHLLPKIPMSTLHDAHTWLKENCKEYAAAHHYESYFDGENALFMQKLHENNAFGNVNA